jgi:hypothetical protein
MQSVHGGIAGQWPYYKVAPAAHNVDAPFSPCMSWVLMQTMIDDAGGRAAVDGRWARPDGVIMAEWK